MERAVVIDVGEFSEKEGGGRIWAGSPVAMVDRRCWADLDGARWSDLVVRGGGCQWRGSEKKRQRRGVECTNLVVHGTERWSAVTSRRVEVRQGGGGLRW